MANLASVLHVLEKVEYVDVAEELKSRTYNDLYASSPGTMRTATSSPNDVMGGARLTQYPTTAKK